MGQTWKSFLSTGRERRMSSMGRSQIAGILDKRLGEVFKNTVSWINYLDFKRIQNSREVPWSIINTNKIIDYQNYTIIVTPKSDYELLYSSDIY